MNPAIWQALDDALNAYREAGATGEEGRVVLELADQLADAADAALGDYEDDVPRDAKELPPSPKCEGGGAKQPRRLPRGRCVQCGALRPMKKKGRLRHRACPRAPEARFSDIQLWCHTEEEEALAIASYTSPLAGEATG